MRSDNRKSAKTEAPDASQFPAFEGEHRWDTDEKPGSCDSRCFRYLTTNEIIFR
jgi:hypothetical protein